MANISKDEYYDTLKNEYDAEQGYMQMCRDAGISHERTPEGIIIDTSGSTAPMSL